MYFCLNPLRNYEIREMIIFLNFRGYFYSQPNEKKTRTNEMLKQ